MNWVKVRCDILDHRKTKMIRNVLEDSSGEQAHDEKWGRIGKVTSRGGSSRIIGHGGVNRPLAI